MIRRRMVGRVFRDRLISDRRDKRYTSDTYAELTREQRALAREFKEGIAEALGVPSEAIKEEPVERWITRFTRAFVKPEYLHSAVSFSNHAEIRALGDSLGRLIKSAL